MLVLSKQSWKTTNNNSHELTRTNINEHKIIYKELSYKIINIAIEVHNTLGSGFLEKVYENSLIVELRKRDIKVEQQKPLKVYYKDEVVGDYFADLLVEEKIILELKCIDRISTVQEAQMINYLRVSSMRLGIILNFAKPKLEYKRIVL